jgi:hypothetical protein
MATEFNFGQALVRLIAPQMEAAAKSASDRASASASSPMNPRQHCLWSLVVKRKLSGSATIRLLSMPRRVISLN